MKLLSGVFLIGFVIFGLLRADLVLAQYNFRDFYLEKDTQSFRDFIYGVGSGFLVANAELSLRARGLDTTRHKVIPPGQEASSPLYCQPIYLTLTAENYFQILTVYITGFGKNHSPDFPMEMVLLHALKHTFPCKN